MTEYEIRKMIRKLSRRRHKLMKKALYAQAHSLIGTQSKTLGDIGRLDIEIQQLWGRVEK